MNKLLKKLVFLIALPLIFISQVNFWQSVVYSNKLIAKSNRGLANSLSGRVDDRLRFTSKVLYAFSYGENAVALYQNHRAGVDYYASMHEVLKEMEKVITGDEDIYALFVYHRQSKQMISRFSETSQSAYQERLEMIQFVKSEMEKQRDSIKGKEPWDLFAGKQKPYVYRRYDRGNIGIVCIVNLESLGLEVGENTELLFADRHGRFINSDFDSRSKMYVFPEGGKEYTISSKGYMVVAEKMQTAPLYIVLAISKSGVLDKISSMQVVLFFVSLLFVIWPFLGQKKLKKQVVIPLQKLSHAMRKNNDLANPIQIMEKFEVSEIEELKNHFNEMTKHITKLKIEGYEQALDMQKIELQYLHLQIKPHFFLNCLKAIHASLVSGHISETEEMVLLFSKHFRYMLSTALQPVSLKEELEHARNYVRIREISMYCPPVYRENIDPVCFCASTPPFSIQSFIENAVKHCYIEHKTLVMHVKASVLINNGKKFVNVIVRNNGGGFTEENLNVLNQKNIDIYDNTHVGLNNIRARMRLMYGEDAILAFYNEGEQAVVDMLWPFIMLERENYECANC